MSNESMNNETMNEEYERLLQVNLRLTSDLVEVLSEIDIRKSEIAILERRRYELEGAIKRNLSDMSNGGFDV